MQAFKKKETSIKRGSKLDTKVIFHHSMLSWECTLALLWFVLFILSPPISNLFFLPTILNSPLPPPSLGLCPRWWQYPYTTPPPPTHTHTHSSVSAEKLSSNWVSGWEREYLSHDFYEYSAGYGIQFIGLLNIYIHWYRGYVFLYFNIIIWNTKQRNLTDDKKWEITITSILSPLPLLCVSLCIYPPTFRGFQRWKTWVWSSRRSTWSSSHLLNSTACVPFYPRHNIQSQKSPWCIRYYW